MNDRRSRRLYRSLLRLAPPRLREQHGDEMTDLFVEALIEARARGRARACFVWCRASSDLIAARLASWIGNRPRPLVQHTEGSPARRAARVQPLQALRTE